MGSSSPHDRSGQFPLFLGAPSDYRTAMAKIIRPAKLRPIAARVARHLDRFLDQKVVDLAAVRDGKEILGKLQATCPGPEALDELHPAHAAYVYVQNQVSILAEALTQLPELDRISNVVGKAEEEYAPDGPPMSPLTRSFFNAWTLFDCGAGIERETIGTILLDLRGRLRMSPEFADILEKWQASRMGLYEVEETTGKTARLRELVSGRLVECVNPTGYKGRVGSIWFVRVLAPPVSGFEQHVIVTTPYEVTAPARSGWDGFLRRTLPKTKITEPARAYEHLMKWGLSNTYWSEYVFEAYVNHETNAIWLMGLPDVPESLPHSRVNSDDQAPLRAYLASGFMATGAPMAT